MKRIKATLIVFGILVSMTTSRATDSKPNVIYILADDLGYGDLGCYGQETLTTPSIDMMAADGMRFTRSYSGSTVCAPSRCSLMTGKHTGHSSIRGNGKANLKPDDVTVAELFKKAGYRTGCFGKWGVGHPLADNDPNEKGFDEFFGYVDTYHAHNFYPEFLVHNGKRVLLNNVTMEKHKKLKGLYERGAGVSVEKNEYAPDLIRKHMHAFIEENHKEPFFLYYAPNTPHANNEGVLYKRGMEVPNFGPYEKEKWPIPEKGFAKMLLDLDNDVKNIRAALEEYGIAKNTLIIFSSDNGPHQEGGHKVDFFDSNGEKRGHKRHLYEGGVRVPMIACWPGVVPDRAVNGTIVAFQDFLPTVAELTAVECPETDGESMMPALLAKQMANTNRTLYWEFPERKSQALLMGNIKLIRYKRGDKYELYDLANDPTESKNIIKEFPEVAAEMKKSMEAIPDEFSSFHKK